MRRRHAALPVAALAAAVVGLPATPALAAPDRDQAGPTAGTEAPTARTQAQYDLDWYLRTSNDPADSSVTKIDNFGRFIFEDGDLPLVCDGRTTSDEDSPALVRGNRFTIPSDRVPAIFRFGRPTDFPLCGDWDGDGVDTAGVSRGNTFYLAASNTTSPAVEVQRFGRPDDVPVVGDWDGDGVDTLGLKRGNTFYLTNSAAGTAVSVDRTFTYGRPDDFPVTGDWDGSSTDNVGLVRGNQWFLSTSDDGDASTSIAYSFARESDYPVSGDWDADDTGTPGVVRIEL